MHANKDAFLSHDYTAIFWALFAIGVVTRIASLSLMAFGWKLIISTFGQNLSTYHSTLIQFKTHIAKYLPLNVFHLAGRVVVAKSAGLSAKASTKSTIIEQVLLLYVLFVFGIPFLVHPLSTPVYILWLLFCFLGALFIPARLLKSVKISFFDVEKFFSRESASDISKVLLSYYTVVAINAYVSYLILGYFLNEIPPFIFFLQAFSLAWLAGIVVIGSPGGIGVREATFILLLPDSSAAIFYPIVILTFRVYSILGELLAFVLSLPFHITTIPPHEAS